MAILKLPAREELDYRKYLFAKNIKFIRIMLCLSLIFYCSFGILDVLLEVDYLNTFLLIRFGIVLPSILLVFGLCFHKSFFKTHQYILTSLYVVASLGIIAMIMIPWRKDLK